MDSATIDPNSQISNPPGGPPASSSQIASGLKAGNDPLDFIKQNLRSTPVQTVVPGSNILTQPNVSQEVVSGPIQQTVTPPPVSPGQGQPPPAVAAPVEPAPVEPAPEPEEPIVSTNELLDLVNKDGKLKSLAHLRKKAEGLESVVREKEQVLTSVLQERDEFKAKVEVELPTLQEKVKKLEHYEKLYAFETSEEAQNVYVQPMQESKSKLKAFAAEYEIPESEMEKALGITNERQLNQFLIEHFDELGASEAKAHIKNIQGLQTRFEQAKQQPAVELENLKADATVRESAQIEQRMKQIGSAATTGWTGALAELGEEGNYPELQIKDGDHEHNQYSRPIVENASTEFGKFVNLLAHLGVKELPPEAAKIIAKRFALSEAALVMSQSRAHHYNAAQEVLETAKRRAPLARPPVGGFMTGGQGAQSSQTTARPASPTAAADLLLNSVLRK